LCFVAAEANADLRMAVFKVFAASERMNQRLEWFFWCQKEDNA
jgi:hypothetical protein